MKKHTSKKQAPGIRWDGEANRALRRAYGKGKPWAHEAVQTAAGNLGRAVAAMMTAFGPQVPAEDEALSPVDELTRLAEEDGFYSDPEPSPYWELNPGAEGMADEPTALAYTPDHLMPTEPMPAEVIPALEADTDAA